MHFCRVFEFWEDEEEGLREKQQQHDETGEYVPPVSYGIRNLPSSCCFFGTELLELLLVGRGPKGTVPPQLTDYVPAEVQNPLPMKGIYIRPILHGILPLWDAKGHGAGGV